MEGGAVGDEDQGVDDDHQLQLVPDPRTALSAWRQSGSDGRSKAFLTVPAHGLLSSATVALCSSLVLSRLPDVRPFTLDRVSRRATARLASSGAAGPHPAARDPFWQFVARMTAPSPGHRPCDQAQLGRAIGLDLPELVDDAMAAGDSDEAGRARPWGVREGEGRRAGTRGAPGPSGGHRAGHPRRP
jgi:hypothetical protein